MNKYTVVPCSITIEKAQIYGFVYILHHEPNFVTQLFLELLIIA